MKSLMTPSLLLSTLLSLPVLAQTQQAAIDLQTRGRVALTDAQASAIQFRTILEDTTGWARNDRRWNDLHFIPKSGGTFDNALKASSISEAIQTATTVDLSQFASDSSRISISGLSNADNQIESNPVTIVIVPGVFGEFIPIDAFEEYFGPGTTSRYRDIFLRKASGVKDMSYTLAAGKTPLELKDLIHVGSIRSKDRREIAPVIIFHTQEASLESLGSITDRAAAFSRRLKTYLNMMGPQKLLFVGYSRGTMIGLEMLSKAYQTQQPWAQSVVGMVSLGGVVWGSSLADAANQDYNKNVLAHRADISEDAKQASQLTADLFERLKEHRQKLLPVAEGNRPATVYAHNLVERGSFLMAVAKNQRFNSKLEKVKPQTEELKNTTPITLSVDPSTIFSLLKKMWDQFTWKVWDPRQYSEDIVRFHTLIDSITVAAEEMQSAQRESWWKQNSLPKHVTYYSVVAAMANPDEAGEYDQKSAFLGADAVGYSQKSFDDVYLLQSRLDYESQTRLSMNDSQVASIQAAFIPEAIARLNPNNTGLQTKFLGVMGTHHWGLALNVVNKMRRERLNPFPREALLKALAAQASQDSRR